ncbi:MAG TPA: cytochrome c [Pyrinomonadaceae bacterium]
MKILRVIIIATFLGALFISTAAFGTPNALTRSDDQFDAAATYKKCVGCHGQKAEKKFNEALSEQELIDAILNGKKPEKPPNMPAYGDKGITSEQAKALVDYMKTLKSAP